jgi:chaperonin GroES
VRSTVCEDRLNDKHTREGRKESEEDRGMTTSLKPLGDRVVVKPKGRDEMTKSGIVLPDTANERPQQGEVLSIGPGRHLESGIRVELDLKVGDTVLFAKYGGTDFKHEDDDLLILSERDILAVIENRQ